MTQRYNISGSLSTVVCFALSKNESLVATAGNGPIVRIWETSANNLVTTLSYYDAENGFIQGDKLSVAFTQGDSCIVIGDLYGTVVVWNVLSKKQRATSDFGAGSILSISCSDSDDVCLAVCNTGKIVLFSYLTPDKYLTLNEGKSYCTVACIVGNYVYSGHADGRVRKWNKNTGELLDEWQADENGIVSMAFSSDKSLIATSANNTVKIWETMSHKIMNGITTTGKTLISFVGDEQILVTSVEGASMSLWSISGPSLVLSTAFNVSAIDVGLSADKECAYILGTDYRMRIYNTGTLKYLSLLCPLEEEVGYYDLTNNGEYLITGGSRHPGQSNVHLFRLHDHGYENVLFLHLLRDIVVARYLISKKCILMAESDGTVILYSLENDEIVHNAIDVAKQKQPKIAVSENEQFMIYGGDDGSVQVIQMSDLRVIYTIQPPVNTSITNIYFTRNDKYIVVQYNNYTSYAWDVLKPNHVSNSGRRMMLHIDDELWVENVTIYDLLLVNSASGQVLSSIVADDPYFSTIELCNYGSQVVGLLYGGDTVVFTDTNISRIVDKVSPWDRGLKSIDVNSPGNIIAALTWDNAVILYDLDFEVNNIKSNQVNNFMLSQAYPNPFSFAATISYTLVASDYVTIDVYNSAGKLVETLYDGYQLNGKHNAIFYSKDLVPGLYYYRIATPQGSVSKKMMLMK